MNTQGILDQLLKGGLGQVLGGMTGQRGGGLGQKPGVDLVRLGGQAAAIGVLNALLRGGARGAARSAGAGGLAKLGGLAALGMLAYKGYEAWQAKQAATPQAPAGAPASPPMITVDRAATPADAEAHSRAILTAMVAAAKADGHVDDAERAQLEGELASQGEIDAATRAWLEAEIRRPLDPAEVAKAATQPGMAAEMYLASLLITGHGDQLGFMERSYLDELARHLQLPEGLKASLQQQAQSLA